MSATWKKGVRFKVDPKVAAQWLQRIHAKQGHLSIDTVRAALDSAPESIRSVITWNDALAADRYRRIEVGNFIRGLTDGDEDIPTRLYSSIVMEGERVYYSTKSALRKKEYRDQVLSQATRDIEIFTRKYQNIKELAELMGVMRRTHKKLVRYQQTSPQL